MDDTVADGVGQDGIANLVLPTTDAELRAEDAGGNLVPGLNDLQQVAGLRFLQTVEQLLIKNQQGGTFVVLDDLWEGAFSTGNTGDGLDRHVHTPPISSRRMTWPQRGHTMVHPDAASVGVVAA